MVDVVSTISSVVSLINEIVNIADTVNKNAEDVEKLAERLKFIRSFLINISNETNINAPQEIVLSRMTNLLIRKDGVGDFLRNMKTNETKIGFLNKIVYRDTIKDQIQSFSSELNELNGDLTLMFVVSSSAAPVLEMETMYSKEPEPSDSGDERAILGEGSFGKVFKMRGKHDRNLYAVKEVSLRKIKTANVDISQLQTEISFLCRLTHPHIVRYFTSFYSKQKRYYNLVMELAEGGTISEQFESQNCKNLTETHISMWMKQCFSALSYMHDTHHILHRDIKPENLLLDRKMHIKVADVGLACVVNSNSFASSKVGGGGVFGV